MSPIGVLALQGDFEAHQRAFQDLDVPTVQVRTAADLESISALVMPGGESTTMLKLISAESMFEALRGFGRERPIFGTCAGAILLAREVRNPEQESLALMDVAIERNAYGRQLNSSVNHVQLTDAGEPPLEAVFIRAPIIRSVGPEVRVLAKFGEDPVLVEQGIHMAATFHPELTSDRRVHSRFLEKVRACQK